MKRCNPEAQKTEGTENQSLWEAQACKDRLSMLCAYRYRPNSLLSNDSWQAEAMQKLQRLRSLT